MKLILTTILILCSQLFLFAQQTETKIKYFKGTQIIETKFEYISGNSAVIDGATTRDIDTKEITGYDPNSYSFQQFIPHGKWINYYMSGKVKEEFNFENGNKTSGKSYFENGVLHKELKFKYNVLHGDYKEYYETGELFHECNYEVGKRKGKGIIYRKDGRILYELDYLESTNYLKIPDHQSLANAVKIEEDGSFSNGRIRVHNDKYTQEGKWESYRSDSVLISIDMYEDGQVIESTKLSNGAINGDFVKYDINGNVISKGSFINGNKKEDWVIYYDENWKETKDISMAKYYREISYINDQTEGTFTDYYISGSKQMEGKLVSKNPEIYDGICIWYYENGQIKDSIPYIYGVINGIAKTYDELGNLYEKAVYENDFIKEYYKYYFNGVLEREEVYTIYIDDYWKTKTKCYQCHVYHQNSNLKEVGKSTLDSKKIGTWEYYDKDENPIKVEIYHNSQGDKLLEIFEGDKLQERFFNEKCKEVLGHQLGEPQPYDNIVSNVTLRYRNESQNSSKVYSSKPSFLSTIVKKDNNEEFIKPNLYNAFNTLYNNYNAKLIDSNIKFADRIGVLDKIEKLCLRMIELADQDTKELERELRKSDSNNEMLKLLGL